MPLACLLAVLTTQLLEPPGSDGAPPPVSPLEEAVAVLASEGQTHEALGDARFAELAGRLHKEPDAALDLVARLWRTRTNSNRVSPEARAIQLAQRRPSAVLRLLRDVRPRRVRKVAADLADFWTSSLRRFLRLSRDDGPGTVRGKLKAEIAALRLLADRQHGKHRPVH